MKKPAVLFRLAAVAALALAASRGGAAEIVKESVSGRLRLPPMEVRPAVDGVLDDAAWSGAARIVGFLDRSTGFSLEPRQGYTLLGYDAENLYIAMSTELPPDGRLVAKVKRNAPIVGHDDGIEIWLDPNRSNRASGTGDQRFYQLVFNSLGYRVTGMWDPAKNIPNLAWSADGYRFANRIDAAAKMWNLELAIPWKCLGADSAGRDGREIGVMIARNWQRPGSQAGFSLCRVPIFAAPQDYAAVALSPAAPVIREESLGRPFEAAFDYRIAIRNTGAADARFRVEASIDASDMPTKTFSREVAVGAGKTESVAAATVLTGYHKTAVNTLNVRVSSADGKTVHFEKSLTIKPARERIWLLEGISEGVVAYNIAYYPTLSKLAVKLDLTGIPGGSGVTDILVDLLDGAKKTVASGSIPVNGRIAEKVFPVPELADGVYTVRATFKGANAPPMEKTFLRKRFPWEKENLGVTDAVYAPFTPVRARGETVETVLRTHRMNGFGLWDSVVSRGREILAAPMTVSGETDAGGIAWSFKRRRFVSRAPGAAVYEAAAESPAVRMRTVSRIEEDGCMRVEMTLSPGAGRRTLKNLQLDIPVKDETAPLWHVALGGIIRSNPVGDAPAGAGTIWDNRKMGSGAMLNNFLPYVWMGGAERGICWFANNDKDWAVDDKTPNQELIRDGGRLTLRIRFVNTPVALDRPRTIVFGLQATPAKPMPADWRNRIQDLRTVHGGANIYWGILNHYYGRYPVGYDYAIVDEMVKVRGNGGPVPPYFETWMKKYIPQGDARLVNEVRASVNGGFNMVRTAGPNPQFIYYEGHALDPTTDEWRVFQDEWGVDQYTPRAWLEKIETWEHLEYGSWLSFHRSYVNFSLWWAREWFRRGLGLYSDNCFLMNCFNTVASDAYVRADGQVQPSANVWELRDYYKRMWKLKQECAKETPYPLMVSLHVTNGQIIPVTAWGDVNLDIEWEWASGRKSFPPDVVLAETAGRQSGSYGFVHYCLVPFREWREMWAAQQKLGAAKANAEPGFVALQRTNWAMQFVHETAREPVKMPAAVPLEKMVRDFGYGRPDCRIVNYWTGDERGSGDPVVACSNPKVKWLGMWKPAERVLLLALVNWDDNGQKAVLTLQNVRGASLGVRRDAETGAPVADGEMEFKGREVKFIRVAEREPGS